MHMAANHGILLRGEVPDTVVMDWLFDENRKGRHGLKQTCKDHLGLRMAPFKEVFGNVGSIDKEVAMVTHFHNVMESGDSDAAAEALVLVGKADGDEEVLKSLRKLSLSKQAGYILDAKKLLVMARKHGLTTKSTGKLAYVSDFLFMLNGGVLPTPAARALFVSLLDDHTLIIEAHDVLLKKLRQQIKIDLEPLEMLKLLVADYASLDAWGSHELVDWYRPTLDDITVDENDVYTLLNYYEETSCPYTRVLWNMERRGVRFDVEEAGKLRQPMAKQIGHIERSVVAIAKKDINLRSPKQLQELFYSKDSNGDWVDRFGESPKFWTKGGASGIKTPSTDKSAIEDWAEKGDPVAVALQEHRTLSKLHDTYLTSVPKWVDHRQRIHTDLKQSVVVTMRLSCVDGSTILNTSAGKVAIQDLELTNSPHITILTHELHQKKITNLFYKGVEEMFEVTLETGEQILCTKTHRFLAPYGWKYLEELVETDEIWRCIDEAESASSHQDLIVGEIRSIRSVGPRPVWDIAVEDDHSYIAHGFVNHNSGDPNLQNIPVKGDWGHKLRSLFIAGKWGDCDPRWCMDELLDEPVPDLDPDMPMEFLVCDYEQLEMRVMAHFSEDETLIDVIKSGRDIHSMTAVLAGGFDYDEMSEAKKAKNPTKRQRDLVDIRIGFKAVGFGLIYGIGEVKLGRQLGLPITSSVSRKSGRLFERSPEAAKLISTYFDIYPKVKQFIGDTKDRCAENLFVQTLTGRYRRLPDIISSDRGVAAQAERQAVNSIIQGSAADIVAQAMLNCERDLELRRLGVRMLLQIHDELMFEVPKIPKTIEKAKKRIRVLMEDPFPMLVPVQVSMGTGSNWDSAK
jgi:DNA polymerase I-like protein with 3'-5' exonuclease and polymerase domains